MNNNMRQAILITAYKNTDQLLEIINYFPDRFNFYIHIDKKSNIDLQMLKNIKKYNVNIYSNYSVKWGGFNHLQAIVFLIQVALRDASNGFFHLISGQDFPIKSVDYFERHLDTSRDYMDFLKMPAHQWPGNGGMDRIMYYNLYDIFDGRKNEERIKNIVRLQKQLHYSRPLPSYFSQLYGGSTWWSLTRSTLQYVFENNPINKKFLERMRFTFCSEEIYFHTIILNSPHAAKVRNNGLRYIDWVSGRGGFPAFLDVTDFPGMLSSTKLFARKLEPHVLSKFKIYSSEHLQIAEQKIIDASQFDSNGAFDDAETFNFIDDFQLKKKKQ